MRHEIRTNAQVFRRVFLVTAISVVSSFAVTLLVTRVVFGADPMMTITAPQFQTLTLALSIFAPLLICPVASYSSSRLMRELNIARNNLQILADTDQLTGLLNRRGFDVAALAALEAARTASRPVAVMICDIDHFKELNDSFGHSFGDESLVHMADILRDFARSHGLIVGRQGGDEFVLMLPGVVAAEAAEIAECIRVACANIIFEGNLVRGLFVSIGIAASMDGEASLSALIRRADVALYEVKRAGRNRVLTADVNEHWSSAA